MGAELFKRAIIEGASIAGVGGSVNGGGIIGGIAGNGSGVGASSDGSLILGPTGAISIQSGIFGEARKGVDAAAMSSVSQVTSRRQLLNGAGMLIGNVGGTMMGGGGQYAQMGSSLGSTAGFLVGHSIAPGIGGFIGGALGGALGGLIGGNQDEKDKENQQPVIKGLEAIERAQRETITTIQSQTDSLLRPENRLMNLPSGFNIPRYQPAFAGGGEGAAMRVSQRFDVNIRIDGASGPAANQIRDAVQDALTDILNNQRRNNGW